MSIRGFKKEIHGLLQSASLEEALENIGRYPPRKLLKPLFAELCSCDELVKWHAVSALGQTVATLADQDLEAARVVMRRCLWMLNDESGGIGWGVPEALGEITACHAGLALEYGHMLVAYLRPDGCYLELEALQRGLLWGVGRLAAVRPALLLAHQAPLYLSPYLRAKEAAVRGLAARALGELGERTALAALQELAGEQDELLVYSGGRLIACTVGELAWQAISHIQELTNINNKDAP